MRPIQARVESAVDWLREHGTTSTLDGLARYAIPSDRAFGVAMRDIKALGATLGRDHELALALWETGWYEARLLVSFVADPAVLTSEQMDRWCADFVDWATPDTLCFHLFDRSPHAWAKVERWSHESGEFQKRTAFALLWSLALHDKVSGDERFIDALELVERAADDERNFVKKAVSMAVKAVGTRSPELHAEALAVAERLAGSSSAPERWVGRDSLKGLQRQA